MRLEKKTHPSRQAKGCAYKSNHSVPRPRLSDEEWAAKWHEIGWQVVALFAAFALFVTFLEVI